MTTPIDSLITLIESRYNNYSAEERSIVQEYLARRVNLDKNTLRQVYEAICEECPIRFGPPDEATIKKAIATYETETGIRLRRKIESVERSSPEPERPSPEEESEILAMAEEAGIDTSQEGWLFRFVNKKILDLTTAKTITDIGGTS